MRIAVGEEMPLSSRSDSVYSGSRMKKLAIIPATKRLRTLG